jgi:hypothetical protein
MEASCKPPSFMDRFGAQKPPSYWEGMLNKTRAELQQFVGKLDKMKQDFFREIADLHLGRGGDARLRRTSSGDDALNMASAEPGQDPSAGAPDGSKLQQAIEQTRSCNCAQYMQQIDEVLTVTIPQWKMALQSRP